LIHDVALQKLPVLFAVDRAGLVGPDGPTHAGSFDLSFLRCIPNMVIMAPADENECRQMLTTGFQHSGPAAVRYPRGKGPGINVDPQAPVLDLGKAMPIRQGKQIALLAFGSMVSVCLPVADELDATLVNMRFIKPLDEDLILNMASRHEILVTIEENAVAGGAGSAINEVLAHHKLTIPVLNLGIPDHFYEQGSREECLTECGLNSFGIIHNIRAFLREQTLANSQIIT
jgi:1-deoxy-D-xylulose-5-phosphate synthase